MRLDESEEIATLRLWFEFGEPAPPSRHSHLGLPRCTGSSVSASGRDWRPLATCFQQRAPAELETIHRDLGPGRPVRARLHRHRLLRQRPGRCELAVGPAHAALCPAVAGLHGLAASRDGLGPGAGARRAVPPARQVLHEPGGPGTRHGQAEPCTAILPIDGETFSSILSSTRSNARRAIPGQRSVLHVGDHLPARVRGVERVLPMVPPAVRREPQRVARGRNHSVKGVHHLTEILAARR